MLKRFLKSFLGVEYKILELPAPRPEVELTSELRESIITLSGHPGFQYLLAKLKLQRAVLENKLKSERHAKIEDVEFLQSGIFWTKWLETQISTLVFRATQSSVPKNLSSDEMDVLQQVLANTQLVGTDKV